jgi:hypothetical protein
MTDDRPTEDNFGRALRWSAGGRTVTVTDPREGTQFSVTDSLHPLDTVHAHLPAREVARRMAGGDA